MDELRAAVRELAAAPSAAGADAFVAAIHRQEASPELAAFIGETLERTALQEIIDSRGVSVRWRLIDRLLGLGFPHALLVTPDDLEYHRAQAGTRWSFSAVFTILVGVLSGLWSGAWLLVLASMPSFRAVWVLAMGSLAVSTLHAFLACIAAANARAHRETLKKLGWMFFVGPAVAALMQLAEPNGGLVTLAMGAPAMLTALLCALTAAVGGGLPSAPVPLPMPVSAPSRQPQATSDRSRLRAG